MFGILAVAARGATFPMPLRAASLSSPLMPFRHTMRVRDWGTNTSSHPLLSFSPLAAAARMRLYASGARARPRSQRTTRRSKGKPGSATTNAAVPLATPVGLGKEGGENVVELFVCERRNFFRIMKLATALQSVFWLFAASFALEIRDPDAAVVVDTKKKKLDDTNTTATFSGGDGDTSSRTTTPPTAVRQARPPLANAPLRYGIALASVGVSVGFLALGLFIPRRFVTRLTLESGARMLRAETYTALARRQLELPVSNVRLQSADPNAIYTTIVPMHVDGRRMFFLLDGKNGTVVNVAAWENFFASRARNTWS